MEKWMAKVVQHETCAPNQCPAIADAERRAIQAMISKLTPSGKCKLAIKCLMLCIKPETKGQKNGKR